MSTTALKAGVSQYTYPNDCALMLTRVFNAPRDLVYDAMTNPKHLPRWLTGPDGWTMPSCVMEARAGGKWRYDYRSADGSETFFMAGTVVDVVPNQRIVTTEQFNGEGEASHNTIELTESGGQTTMVLISTFPSKEIRDMVLATGMTGGMDTSYDRLDALFPSIA